ncbi:MAG: T9SS type A sorting domain-containing protein [Saprospiraceae bacterium]|nr:T9SS type A sorting domain-containing protein [Saprospiraceae bacterium]
MKKILSLSIALFLVAMLAPTLSAQQLVSSGLLGTRTRAQLQAQFGFFIQNGIRMYRITYTTPDISGQPDTASGLLVVPVRNTPSSYPLMCYQHGTVDSRTDVPSNLQGGWELAAVFGGMGYVTAAPDFLGLGEARGFHPYVHAETEASAAVDMLFAVREFAEEDEDLVINDQLFISGYSQGGHAGMALHRSIEQDHSDQFTVTAAAHMSGPYSISGAMRDKILSDEPYYFAAYLPFTVLSYDLAYGLFDDIEQYFKQPYADMIEQFYNEDINLGDLNTMLIDQLELEFGASVTKNMFQDSILQAVINDPNHPANVALRANDVYEWAPVAPTRLYYCQADDQVTYRNSIIADSVMSTVLGALAVDAINVNPNADHGGCVQPAVTAAIFFFANLQEITVGSNEVAAGPRPALYPNPANENFQVKNAPAGALVQLLTLDGRPVFEASVSGENQSVALPANFQPGVYLAQIIWDNGFTVEKLVIGK